MPNWDRMADRANRRSVKTFSTPVQLPDGQVIGGVFDIPTEEGQLAKLELDYSVPVITVLDGDAALINDSDTLVIKGKEFTAGKQLPDGTGITVILLADTQSSEAGNWL
ncbi:hypothetical protein GZ77_09135 [Endozoicomonas montiporae]|uniref:Phage protein n=2 Tax=Endozoicomonas montiporae TaxID=1027273 RepID=A0A081N7T1_9GAMM|nr:hypothetical protein [Endozoicomonas montiporae]AMO55633.1 hypothetical protein EZMO1_1463 [Endozoicomonas montiporae CL-33]KEQ14504.1 hypothetical protein GZ77_09135 [Endozoicomonas montiporae]